MSDVRIVAILLLGRRHIAVDDGRVLAMGHNRQAGSSKDAVKGFTTVDKHVARRRPHEELDAGNAAMVKASEEVAIVVGGTEEEAIVHMTLLCRQAELLFQSLQGRCLRHAVGHIKIGGDTSGGSGTALAVDVSLVGQTRLTEVDVVVDNARQYEASRSVYRFIDSHIGTCKAFCY